MVLLSNSNNRHTTSNNNITASNEFLICFSSKSILSPGQPMSLSSSLSRRQASPMYTRGGERGGGGGKKRGCGFENPEPSSPKVTCIGQVRVKTKKKVHQTRSLSRRRSSRRIPEQGIADNGCRSYARATSSSHQQFLNQQQRDCLRNRSQRWVHLPLTICEALRAFGAEFSCLLPCSSSGRGREEEWNEPSGHRSCGDVFCRWLVTLQDGECGKGREIELVVGGDEETNEDNVEMRSSRRHVLQDFKVNDDGIFGGNGRGEEEGRVSICIPPKNALLLMRCRSDPIKMAALTNRFSEPCPPQEEEEEEEPEEEEDGDVFYCKRSIFGEEVVKEIVGDVLTCEAPEEVKETVLKIENVDSIEVDEVLDLPMEVHSEKVGILQEEVEGNAGEEGDFKKEAELNQDEEDFKEDAELKKSELLVKAEELTFMGALEDHIKNIESEGILQIVEEESCTVSCASFPSAFNQVEEDGETEQRGETESINEKGSTFITQSQLEYQTEDLGNTHENEEVKDQEMETSEQKSDKESETEVDFERRDQFMIEDTYEIVDKVPSSPPKPSVLPDCLLLMMYEPKLSMEVSKETWVCSRDFTRWLPQRHKHVKQPVVAKTDDTIIANPGEGKKRISTDLKKSESLHQAKQVRPPARPTKLVPHRSSCSYPVSMATMIEHKIANGIGYEPLVLSRCKSEPMRTAGKLAAAMAHDAFHVGTTRVGY